MNEFLQALPWRLAALAGLVIGSVSFVAAQVDFWLGVQRIAVAFGLFYGIGFIARQLLILATPAAGQRSSASGPRSDGEPLQS